jgi:signal transduction histidine kinase
VLTRVFDDRYAYLRLTLLACSGVGYLVLLRDPVDEPRTWIAWLIDITALVICPACARWPVAGALAQTGLLTAASLCDAPLIIPAVGASWTALELALRRPPRTVGLAAVAWFVGYLVIEREQLPGELLPVLYTLLLNVGIPVLFGANIRAARLLAEEAEERVAAEQRRRVSDAQAVRAGERTAIARELHDVVAHHVASIVLRVGVVRHVLPDADPRMTAVLDDVHATGTSALADLRQLVRVLRDPAALPDQPITVSIEPSALPAALATTVDRARQTGITVDATIDPRMSTLDSVRGLAVLRLTQEGLTNVARHAGPSARARLLVEMRGREVVWELVDDGGDGSPQVPQPPGGGHGIAGMRERVEVLGGQLEAGPDGPGWRLRTELPERIGQPA